MADDVESMEQIIPMVHESEPSATPELIVTRLKALVDSGYIDVSDISRGKIPDYRRLLTEPYEDYGIGYWFGLTDVGILWREQHSAEFGEAH